MDALILDSDYGLQMAVARALTGRGCTVICVDSIRAAEAFVRLSPPDLLVMGERIGGRLTHPVALLAECQNPDLAAILLSDRSDDDLGEVFDLLPAVRAVCGRNVDPETIGQVMLCVTGAGRPVSVLTQPMPVRRVAVAEQAWADVPDGPDARVGAVSDDMVMAVNLAPPMALSADPGPDAVSDTGIVASPDAAPPDAAPTKGRANEPIDDPLPPSTDDQARWRAALELVTGGRIDGAAPQPAQAVTPDARHPVLSTSVGAPRAAWWEDWEPDGPAAQPQRAMAGGRRMTLG